MGKCEGCSGCTAPAKMIEIGNKYKGIPGGVISALHEVQDEYGFISESNQKYLSDMLDVPLSEIFGVITFYSRFSLQPKGKYNIQVCMGTACYVKGSEKVLFKLKELLGIGLDELTKDGMFSIESVRCIGACALAPAVVVNEDVYGSVTEDSIEDIIAKYKVLEEK